MRSEKEVGNFKKKQYLSFSTKQELYSLNTFYSNISDIALQDSLSL